MCEGVGVDDRDQTQLTNVPVRKLKDYLNTWICVETKAEVVSFTVPPSRLMGCVLELCPTYSKMMKLTQSSGTIDLCEKVSLKIWKTSLNFDKTCRLTSLVCLA